MKIIRFLRKFVSRVNIELSSKIMYRFIFHKKLDLNNPKTLSEKICWLKLREYPNNNKVIQCTDKFLVRKYVEDKGLEKILVRLLGVWDNPDEINWELLPNKFVLKCTHGCAYNIICTDKSDLDKKMVCKKLNEWLKEDFSLVSGEPHYKTIPHRIICEEYIEGGLKDYKFFCFKGKPEFYYVAITPLGDFHNNLKCDFFWPNGEPTDFYRLDHQRLDAPEEIPENLKEMIEIAKELSSDFEFVRVDLMNVENELYFSELTFTPCAGMMPLAPKGTDEKLGNLLKIDNK